MYYRVNDHIALRGWKNIPFAYYVRGEAGARQLTNREFLCLLLFDLTLLAQEVHLGFLTRQLYGHPSHLGTHHEIEHQGSHSHSY